MKIEALEKRIMQVSEMLGERFLKALTDFRAPTCGGNYIWHPRNSEEAQEILAPDLENLHAHLRDVCQANKLKLDLFHAIEARERQTSYAIGMIAGLHLAGRVDLVSRFASIYGEVTEREKYHQYDQRGKLIEDCE